MNLSTIYWHLKEFFITISNTFIFLSFRGHFPKLGVINGNFESTSNNQDTLLHAVYRLKRNPLEGILYNSRDLSI